MKPRYQCIFCFKTDLEVPFSEEHLIPDCIYGLLYFDSIVCKSCNDWFGYKVDLQILRLPEIANAFKELGYTKEYEIILKNNYNINGKLGDGTEIKVYIKNQADWEQLYSTDEYIIQDLDKILVSYGSENEDEIKNQQESVTDKAKDT